MEQGDAASVAIVGLSASHNTGRQDNWNFGDGVAKSKARALVLRAEQDEATTSCLVVKSYHVTIKEGSQPGHLEQS